MNNYWLLGYSLGLLKLAFPSCYIHIYDLVLPLGKSNPGCYLFLSGLPSGKLLRPSCLWNPTYGRYCWPWRMALDLYSRGHLDSAYWCHNPLGAPRFSRDSFLTQEEKAILIHRLRQDAGTQAREDSSEKFQWKHFRVVFWIIESILVLSCIGVTGEFKHVLARAND